LGALLLALVSPIAYFDITLQWDHMLQHVLLLLVAPPLILMADPFRTAWAGYLAAQGRPISIDGTWPARVMRVLHSRPRAATVIVVLFSMNLLFWHVPPIYDDTLRIASIHDLEHLSFLVLGLLFWDQVISPVQAPGRLSLMGRATVVIAGTFVSWALAIAIGYASHPLYAYPTPAGGFSLLADQQIAAGVMWVQGQRSVPHRIALPGHHLVRRRGPQTLGCGGSTMSGRQLALAGAAAVLVAACGGSHPTVQATPKVTALSGPTLTGKTVSITALHGHPVVLVFWGSWCGPCRHDQPQMNSLYAKWSPRGVDFLGIDLRDDNKAALTFQSQLAVPYLSIADSNMTIAIHYHIPSAPGLVFLDTQGRVADAVLGSMSVADFNADVTRLLGVSSASA